jgi:hypothetical protein
MKMITVELQMDDYMQCKSEAERQLLVRVKLRGAGIPLGPWGSSIPERGILAWNDDLDRAGIRVVTWRDDATADASHNNK